MSAKQTVAVQETVASTVEGEDTLESNDDLYEKEIQRFRKTLRRDLDTALNRYGLSLFHSLEDAEKLELKEKLGFKPVDEIDHFNIGTVAAAQGDFQKAKKSLAKAVELKGDFADALLNLALVYEQLGNVKSAKQYLKEYIKLSDDDEEKQSVEEHLGELE